MAFNMRSILGRNKKPAPMAPMASTGSRPPGALPRPGAQPAAKPAAQSGPARPLPSNPDMYRVSFAGNDGRRIAVTQKGEGRFNISQYKGDTLDYDQETNEVFHDPKSGRLSWRDMKSGGIHATGTIFGGTEYDNREGGHGIGRGGKDRLKPPTWASHLADGWDGR